MTGDSTASHRPRSERPRSSQLRRPFHPACLIRLHHVAESLRDSYLRSRKPTIKKESRLYLSPIEMHAIDLQIRSQKLVATIFRISHRQMVEPSESPHYHLLRRAPIKFMRYGFFHSIDAHC